MIKRLIARFFFFVAGWKVRVPKDANFQRCVMLAAPHTTNWDYPIAQAACWILGIKWRYFIKDSYTKNPLFGWFFRATGAIGVDRSKPKSGYKRGRLVEFAIKSFEENNELVVLVPAEGTRKRVDKWKTGFYHIALGANIPIALGFMDFGKKETGVLDVFMPSGNFEQDMHHIQEMYRPIVPKYPENYNPEIY